jgi:hypothetical protein
MVVSFHCTSQIRLCMTYAVYPTRSSGVSVFIPSVTTGRGEHGAADTSLVDLTLSGEVV